MNSVNLIGRLTRDPEIKYLASGTAVCNASIAVNSRRKRGDTWEDEVHFFDLTIWGRTAEVLSEYAAKGSEIGVTGELRQERWEDRDTGKQRSKVIVSVNHMQMLRRSEQQDNRTPAARKPAAAAASAPAQDFDDSDVPF